MLRRSLSELYGIEDFEGSIGGTSVSDALIGDGE